MSNLAIVFALDQETGQTFSLSREVDSHADKTTIYDYLRMEAQLLSDQIDTILVVKSQCDTAGRPETPEVMFHWTAGNGDFEGL